MKVVELAELAEPSELAKLMELAELAEQVELEELAELVERTETTDRNIRVCDCPFSRSNRLLPCAAGRAEQPDSLHRSTRSRMQHVEVDCVEMYPFATPPTSDKFLRASLRSAHAWVRQTARVSQRPAVQKLLEHSEFGVMLAGVYLDNMAKHTGELGFAMVGARAAASAWVDLRRSGCPMMIYSSSCCRMCGITAYLYGTVRTVMNTIVVRQVPGTHC